MEETCVQILSLLFAWGDFFPLLKALSSVEQCRFSLQYISASLNMYQESPVFKEKSVFVLSLIVCGHFSIPGEVSKGTTSSPSCQRFWAFKWWFRHLCGCTEKSKICIVSDSFRCWKGESNRRRDEWIRGDVLHSGTHDFALWKCCITHICYIALRVASKGWKHLCFLH